MAIFSVSIKKDYQASKTKGDDNIIEYSYADHIINIEFCHSTSNVWNQWGAFLSAVRNNTQYNLIIDTVHENISIETSDGITTFSIIKRSKEDCGWGSMCFSIPNVITLREIAKINILEGTMTEMSVGHFNMAAQTRLCPVLDTKEDNTTMMAASAPQATRTCAPTRAGPNNSCDKMEEYWKNW